MRISYLADNSSLWNRVEARFSPDLVRMARGISAHSMDKENLVGLFLGVKSMRSLRAEIPTKAEGPRTKSWEK